MQANRMRLSTTSDIPGTRAGGANGGSFRRLADAGAFTLIELLVVVGIIAVLIAILLPALSAARNEGTKTRCMSNLRGLSQCLHMYSEDDEKGYTSPIHPKAETSWLYDGEYEYGGKTGVGVFADPDFRQENRLLNKYVYGSAMGADLDLYDCPGDKGVDPAPVNFEPFFTQADHKNRRIFDLTGTSYRLNNHIDFLGQTPYTQFFYGPYFRPKTRVPSTSETVILEETVAEVAKWNAANYATTGWHAKRNIFNVAFVDGHAANIYLTKQNDISSSFNNYWVLRGTAWRMDCYPDDPVKDNP